MNVGDVIGNYEITSVLGEGGMGVVYIGKHELLGREAAIKVLLPSLSNKQDVVQRFFNEAKTTTSIKHPGIVEVFDFGYSEDGHAFIVMELLEGETLDQRIRRLGRLPAPTAISIFRQIGRALSAAHELDIVHRDLKPENIYIVSDPDVAGGERTKILDFGIAKLRNAANPGVRTGSGQVMGAPDYMAPEQALGASEVDQRADLYSLGCMLFHAVTGRPPFQGAGFSEVMAAHVSKQAPRASSMAPVPTPIDDLIAKLMTKAPDERPQSASEFLEILDGAEGAKPGAPPKQRTRVPAGPSTPPPIPPAAASRRTAIAQSQPPPTPPTTAGIGPGNRAPGSGIPGIGGGPPSSLDTSSPLPPLPRPKAPTSLPPPIPKAQPSAKTLYQSDISGGGGGGSAGPATNPPLPRPGPASSAGMPAQVSQLPPGVSSAGLAKTVMPMAGQSFGAAPNVPNSTLRPPQQGNPVLSVPGPAVTGPRVSGPQPMVPAQSAPAGVGPRGTMALPSHAGVSHAGVSHSGMGQPMAKGGQAFGQPLAPARVVEAQRPAQRRPQPAGMDAGPRRGHNVRPLPPPRPEGRSGWTMPVVIVILLGASAGGFFFYKSRTSKKATADTNGTAIASNVASNVASNTATDSDSPTPGTEPAQVVTLDAGVVAAASVATDASAIAAAPIDAGTLAAATPVDAAAAAPIDAAALIATNVDPPPDPIPEPARAIDAAPPVKNSGIGARSGRVIDPALSSATGDDGVETVALVIESKPPGAIVYRTHDNLRLGKTPIEYVTKKFNANETFALKLNGFYDVSVKMSTNRNGKRRELLLAKPKR